MKLSFKQYTLRLKHPFTLSRGSSDTRQSVIVEIEHDGLVGYGEAAPIMRYGESAETVVAFLNMVHFPPSADPANVDELLDYVHSVVPGNYSAKAAIDIALHDWNAKAQNTPPWKLWGLDGHKTLVTSFTIGIDSLNKIEQKVKEAEEYPIFKVKLGVPNDQEIISTIRRLTEKTIRVDANEGWTDKHLALDKVLWLENQLIELVEQPLPASQIDDMAWLHEQVHIPLIADESVKHPSDLSSLRGAFDGINIKLMKCGGLREARKMINAAKKLNLKVMLGCMIETSVGISAAAQLTPLADYADLDGSLLIENDPFEGTIFDNGKIRLNESNGLGVRVMK